MIFLIITKKYKKNKSKIKINLMPKNNNLSNCKLLKILSRLKLIMLLKPLKIIKKILSCMIKSNLIKIINK